MEWELRHLNALTVNPLHYNALHQQNTAAHFALNFLVTQGYVDVMGANWKTALFTITDKGRVFLFENSAKLDDNATLDEGFRLG